ncbi:MAG TPA: TlpA disulfide reductase family protein [Dehalococcoidia bacterium]|nr:TlpA disulfide reductase family protein [Dehalococcoidia bacterium]
MELERHPLIRRLLVVAILGVIVALFVQREMLSNDATGGTDGETALGMLTANTPEIGSLAPDFTVETRDGTLRLSDFRGQSVVLNFWASWCSPCLEEMPEFQQLHEQRAADGDLAIIAINFAAGDSRSAALDFIDAVGITFTVAFDTDDGAVADRYGVIGLPATFFIDRDGILRLLRYGPVIGDALTEGVAMADAGAS